MNEAAKTAARKAAFARRKAAHQAQDGRACGALSELLAGYRGVPVAGYMPIRSEIDPLPAMAEAAAHGIVGVPVIVAAGEPLVFAQWEPEMAMAEGPFGAQVPALHVPMVPEIVIVPLVAFVAGGLAMAAGSMIGRWPGCVLGGRCWRSDLPIRRRRRRTCRSKRRISRSTW